jgi:5-hydroxyisourate hydrolase-like protein (transthyretin family)
MIRAARFFAPLLALGLLMPLAHAQDNAATGTISGKVTTADGKPAANVQVRVLPAAAHKKKAEGQAAKAKGDRPQPVASGTTDADGNFKLDNVPTGDYTVMAGAKGVGMGREKVSVKAGESATVNITLQAPKAK